MARQLPEIMLLDESYADAFLRVLAERASDVMTFTLRYPEALVVWAGDFNQALRAPEYTGTTAGRGRLAEALAGLGTAAWNADATHLPPGASGDLWSCGGRPRSYGSLRPGPRRVRDEAG